MYRIAQYKTKIIIANYVVNRDVVRVIKSRRLRWAGHVARMEEGRSAFKILTGKPTGKRPFGRTILEWTLKR